MLGSCETLVEFLQHVEVVALRQVRAEFRLNVVHLDRRGGGHDSGLQERSGGLVVDQGHVSLERAGVLDEPLGSVGGLLDSRCGLGGFGQHCQVVLELFDPGGEMRFDFLASMIESGFEQFGSVIIGRGEGFPLQFLDELRPEALRQLLFLLRGKYDFPLVVG